MRLWWEILGGLAAVSLLKSKETTDDTEEAVANGGTLNVRLTGYWPYQSGLTAEQRLMEGGQTDTHGQRLYTLEDFQNGSAPYVSVSGDDAIWPYGQRLEIDNWPGVVFRVVDTGGHFRGAGKVYRVAGFEPLDVCVAGPDTPVAPALSSARIIAGDYFADARPTKAGGDVRTDLIRGQEVT